MPPWQGAKDEFERKFRSRGDRNGTRYVWGMEGIMERHRQARERAHDREVDGKQYMEAHGVKVVYDSAHWDPLIEANPDGSDQRDRNVQEAPVRPSGHHQRHSSSTDVAGRPAGGRYWSRETPSGPRELTSTLPHGSVYVYSSQNGAPQSFAGRRPLVVNEPPLETPRYEPSWPQYMGPETPPPYQDSREMSVDHGTSRQYQHSRPLRSIPVSPPPPYRSSPLSQRRGMLVPELVYGPTRPPSRHSASAQQRPYRQPTPPPRVPPSQYRPSSQAKREISLSSPWYQPSRPSSETSDVVPQYQPSRSVRPHSETSGFQARPSRPSESNARRHVRFASLQEEGHGISPHPHSPHVRFASLQEDHHNIGSRDQSPHVRFESLEEDHRSSRPRSRSPHVRYESLQDDRNHNSHRSRSPHVGADRHNSSSHSSGLPVYPGHYDPFYRSPSPPARVRRDNERDIRPGHYGTFSRSPSPPRAIHQAQRYVHPSHYKPYPRSPSPPSRVARETERETATSSRERHTRSQANEHWDTVLRHSQEAGYVAHASAGTSQARRATAPTERSRIEDEWQIPESMYHDVDRLDLNAGAGRGSRGERDSRDNYTSRNVHNPRTGRHDIGGSSTMNDRVDRHDSRTTYNDRHPRTTEWQPPDAAYPDRDASRRRMMNLNRDRNGMFPPSQLHIPSQDSHMHDRRSDLPAESNTSRTRSAPTGESGDGVTESRDTSAVSARRPYQAYVEDADDVEDGMSGSSDAPPSYHSRE